MRMLLVLSFGGSLRQWREDGILTREIEIYLQYLKHDLVDRLHIFSYAHDDDTCLIEAPESLRRRIVLLRPPRPLRTHLSRLLYSLSPRNVWAIRAKVDVAKTNQVSGSWVALLLRLLGVRVFARCGYLLSRHHWKKGHYGAFLVSYPLEWLLFSIADIASVTTEAAVQSIRRRTACGKRAFVAPTYVDTDVFRADAATKSIDDTVIFVGRLEAQKNVLNLVQACRSSGMALQIVGTGSLEPAVVELAAAIGADVRIARSMPNNQIAELFKSHRYFALPSVYEGLPKSLIEAMSSEMVCIGTNVPGTADLLTDGVTGYLCDGLDAASIARTIERARADPSNAAVAKAARAFVLERHSIRTYLDREHAAIERWVRPKFRIRKDARKPAY
ncbi:MAG: glycosyltransferase family 4 protein [Rhodospirillales bacterium]|nr:glycosyltransferase family 4 protein [Rhodospirillales bacterium]